MENKRLLYVAFILLAAVIVLLYVMQSGGFSSMEKRKQLVDDIRSGSRSTRGTVGKTPKKSIDRPHGAADRILEIRLPEGDARRLAGGAVVLALQGNNVLRRRKDPGRLIFIRSVLGRVRADALLQGALDLKPWTGDPAGMFQVTTMTAVGRKTVAATAEQVRPFLDASQPKERTWYPERIHLQLALEPLAGPGTKTLLIPWPFRRVDPLGFLENVRELKVTRNACSKLFGAWRPGTLLELTGDEVKQHFKVVNLEVL